MANPETLISRARGSLLGLFTGDALGATVEFKPSWAIEREFPSGLRDMVGGGPHKTLPGQITDDGELAIGLLRSLSRSGTYDPNAALSEYRRWRTSEPFDIGFTTKAGLAGKHDLKSESNGALMRVAPIAMVGARQMSDIVAEWARADAELTHPNPVCLDANEIFVRAIHFTLNSDEQDPARLSEVLHTRLKGWAARLSPWVPDLVRRAVVSGPPGYFANQGHVLIALHNALFQLANAPNLEEAVVDTVMQGGDTDTNGAVCGALLGAVYGEGAVPVRWIKAVLESNPSTETAAVHPRAEDWWPSTGIRLLEDLLSK